MGNNLAGRLAGKSTAVVIPEDNIEAAIMNMEARFAQAMPRGMEAAQLVRDAMNVLRSNPKLAQCEPNSVMGALMTCAQLGLRPGIGALGQAHLVPFWNSKLERPDGKKGGFAAQFIIGYQGMIELANRSGEIDLIVARDVCRNDEFRIDYGTDELHHIPAMDGRGEVVGYYAKFYRKGGTRPTFEFMSKKDAEEHRDQFATARDRNKNIFGPWVDHFDAMAKKTCVRRIFRWMPKSTEVQNAIIADETVRIDYNPSADLAAVAARAPEDDAARQAVQSRRPDEESRETAAPETGEIPPGMTPEEYQDMIDRESRGE